MLCLPHQACAHVKTCAVSHHHHHPTCLHASTVLICREGQSLGLIDTQGFKSKDFQQAVSVLQLPHFVLALTTPTSPQSSSLCLCKACAVANAECQHTHPHPPVFMPPPFSSVAKVSPLNSLMHSASKACLIRSCLSSNHCVCSSCPTSCLLQSSLFHPTKHEQLQVTPPPPPRPPRTPVFMPPPLSSVAKVSPLNSLIQSASKACLIREAWGSQRSTLKAGQHTAMQHQGENSDESSIVAAAQPVW
jgi:hypothetical protein